MHKCFASARQNNHRGYMDNTKNVTSHCIKLDFICSSAFLREGNKIIRVFGKDGKTRKEKRSLCDGYFTGFRICIIRDDLGLRLSVCPHSSLPLTCKKFAMFCFSVLSEANERPLLLATSQSTHVQYGKK